MAHKQFLKSILVVVGYLIITPTQAYAVSKSSDMTSQLIGRAPSNFKVENPADYYENRVLAISLARKEQWKEAQPILEELTSQYQDDGDTWYLLGLSYLQHEQWGKAILSLEKTLELGAFLTGIPSGSRPSNDIMVKISKAYASLGDKDNSIMWLNKALDARYDERKELAGDEGFNNIKTSKEFQIASGTYFDDTLSRDEAWHFDLQFLVSEIKRLHVNMYHAVDEETFQSRVDTIADKIPTLTDKQIVFEFMELVGMLGNGHNFIIPTYAKKGNFLQLPMQFYWFSDGLYIVRAEEAYRQYIGSRIDFIGDTAIDDALERVKKINARDNEMQQLWLSPYYLSLPSVLEGLGIVKKSNDVTITITNAEGTQMKLKPKALPMSFGGFPKLPALEGSDALHNLKANDKYWYKYSKPNKSMYVQFNYVQEKKSQTLKAFSEEIRKKITQLGVENLILDIRHNAGGNGAILPPVLKTLIQFEALKPDGKVFVVIGRNTFSAGHNLLTWISQFTNAVIVGEPSGSRPNALSEAGWFKLPYSGTWGIISSQFHQASEPEDHRIWIAPHVPTNLSSEDYFAGKDPALEAIYRIIEHNNKTDK